MQFELDKILIDDIIYFMENHDGDYLLDIQEGQVVDINNHDYGEDTDFENDDRFICLPEWSSADGYRLMERFAAGLKKPVVREELARALNRNRGVFRAYRDVLQQYPETEKQWFGFKEQEMKNEVIAWYNALREEWGLEPIGSEPEDNSSLVLEDFIIKEQLTENSEQEAGKKEKEKDSKVERRICFVAETANGELAGTIGAEINGANLFINILEVKPEFRGMGIGKTLLDKIVEKADREKFDIIIDLPVEIDYFSRALHLENFKLCIKRFIRKN